MKKADCYHQAKSSMAYNIDAHTLHLRLRTVRAIAKTVAVIHGDPFMWVYDNHTESYIWQAASQTESLMVLEASTTDHDYWFVEIKVPTKRVKYAFMINKDYLYGSKQLIDLRVHSKEKHNLFNYFNFPYLLEVDTYSAPAWVKDTVWYSIFPDRFHNLDNTHDGLTAWESTEKYRNDLFFGGNLKGITEKLDYIKDLGINGLYLNPIFKSPSAHKYDTIDYMQIDPQFGSKEDLKKLVDAAHERGIKIVLDAVFNHVSHRHPFFQDALKRGKASPYFEAFYFTEWPVDDKVFAASMNRHPVTKLPYETFAFTPRMPKVNTEHPLIRQHFLDVASYWIKHFNIDGWRLDVSNEVSHDFWRVFRKTIKALEAEAFILGENWDHSDAWLHGDQFDAVMNYEFMFPIWAYFGLDGIEKSLDGSQFKDIITETILTYPKTVFANMFNLLDSHDTRRIASVMAEDIPRLKLVYLFLFTLPGTPSIYYGGEIGLAGEHDPDNRRCMIWDDQRQNQTLLSFLKKLIHIYRHEPAFRQTDFLWRHCDDHVMVIQKGDLLVCLNKSNTPHRVELRGLMGTFDNLYDGGTMTLSESLTIDKTGFGIYKKR